MTKARDENKKIYIHLKKYQTEKPPSYLELCGNSEFNTQDLIENCSRKSFSLQKQNNIQFDSTI